MAWVKELRQNLSACIAASRKNEMSRGNTGERILRGWLLNVVRMKDVTTFLKGSVFCFKKSRVILFLLTFLTAALYFQTIGYEFVSWDDNVNVYKNAHVSEPSLANALKFWKEPYSHMYIPLTYTVWTGLAALSKMAASGKSIELDPLYFHTANLLLHIISVCAIFFLLRLILSYLKGSNDDSAGGERENIASFLGALLFAVHPLQVEAVTWVTGMKDLLSGTLGVLALWQYLLWSDKCENLSHKRSVHIWAATVFYSLALLGKPTAIVVPALAFMLDYLLINRSFKKVLLRLSGWFLLSIIIILIAKSSQSYDNSSLAIPALWQRPLVFLDSISFYLLKVLYPVNLGVDYGRTPSAVLKSASTFFTVSAPLLLALALYKQKNRKTWMLATGISIAGILPVSGLIPFGFQFFSSVADRYFYISMLGPSLAATSLIYFKRSRAVTLCFTLLLLLLGVKTASQTGNWQNSERLFTHTLKVNQKSFVAHNNLGTALVKKGRLQEGIYHFQEAVRINPGFYQGYNNLGGAFFMAGNVDMAVESVKRVLEINPSFEKARLNLGNVLYQNGRFGEARFHFEEALRVSPSSVTARLSLANTLLALGEQGKALREARKILDMDTSCVKAYTFIASVMSGLGKMSEAESVLKVGESLNPGSRELRRSLDTLYEEDTKGSSIL